MLPWRTHKLGRPYFDAKISTYLSRASNVVLLKNNAAGSDQFSTCSKKVSNGKELMNRMLEQLQQSICPCTAD